MMTSIAQIRLNAQAAILERHPELNGLVSFDAVVNSIDRGMHMLELRITAHSNQPLIPIARAVEPCSYAPPRQWPLGLILNHYCSHDEPYDFELDGLDWLIGDGDDSFAVTEVGPDTVLLWVRAWEES